MPIGDMIEHVYIVSKYVDRIFTFAYPHYIGTVTTVDGYYNTYVSHQLLERKRICDPGRTCR